MTLCHTSGITALLKSRLCVRVPCTSAFGRVLESLHVGYKVSECSQRLQVQAQTELPFKSCCSVMVLQPGHIMRPFRRILLCKRQILIQSVCPTCRTINFKSLTAQKPKARKVPICPKLWPHCFLCCIHVPGRCARRSGTKAPQQKSFIARHTV